jgi:hypothetical protein
MEESILIWSLESGILSEKCWGVAAGAAESRKEPKEEQGAVKNHTESPHFVGWEPK